MPEVRSLPGLNIVEEDHRDKHLRAAGVILLLLLCWLFLFYDTGPDPKLQSAPVVATSVPEVSMPPLVATAMTPPADRPLWGHFPSDCWLQAIVDGEVVLSRFFQAGDRLDYSGRLPDQLILGSASAQIWLQGERLSPDEGIQRETAVSYPIRRLQRERSERQGRLQ